MSYSYSKVILFILAIITLVSCVPNRKFMDVAQKQEACERENEQLRLQNEKLSTDLNEFDTKYNVSGAKN